jgi:hypothetical protein
VQVRALIASLATLGFGVALASCGSNSPGQVVVEPGITAIRESSELACNLDLQNLLQAIDSYRTLNFDPPLAESDLVPNWLRSESQLYDLTDGQIVPAAGSECSPITGAATGTPTDNTLNEELELVSRCTARFKTLQVAIEAYYVQNGTSTVPTQQVLLDTGLLAGLEPSYDIDPVGQVVLAPGSDCTGVELADDTITTPPTGSVTLPDNLLECEEERAVLRVAMDAYFATSGSAAASEADLVSADWLRQEFGGYDIVDGAVVPAPGSICPPD